MSQVGTWRSERVELFTLAAPLPAPSPLFSEYPRASTIFSLLAGGGEGRPLGRAPADGVENGLRCVCPVNSITRWDQKAELRKL